MSGTILSIAAEADKTLPQRDDEVLPKACPGPSLDEFCNHSFAGTDGRNSDRFGKPRAGMRSTNGLETGAGHRTQEHKQTEEPAEAEAQYDRFEEKRRRAIYRGKTIWMLRRYMRYSLDTGRLPSIVGREFFRTKITRHTPVTFEDRVIFVHDMETCLHRLDEFSQEVIGRIVLQEYRHEEAAHLLGCTRMTVHRALVEGLDKLSSILLRVGLIERLHWRSEKSCQGGNSDDFLVNDCKYGE
jgi:DNA-directed RNA polymerase specialized sigma24 family protein